MPDKKDSTHGRHGNKRDDEVQQVADFSSVVRLVLLGYITRNINMDDFGFFCFAQKGLPVLRLG